MNKKVLIISVIAVIISFIGGFFVANSINRKQIADLQTELGSLKNAPKKEVEPDTESTLSEQEIRDKIDEADGNPENLEFQKSLALALYRYSTIKQDALWLPDVIRLLTRAYDKNPEDHSLLVTLANIYFDISLYKPDEVSIKKSRELYQKALEIKPNDADVRTDLGLTYLLVNPPENDKAVIEFNKSLKINSKHERTLQSLAQAMIALGKPKEAADYISKLKEVNPASEAIAELNSKLTENNTQK